MKYRRGVINKHRAMVSGMCDTSNSSNSTKGVTVNYSDYYGDAIIWSLVCHSRTFILSVKPEYLRIGTSLNILVTQNSKT